MTKTRLIVMSPEGEPLHRLLVDEGGRVLARDAEALAHRDGARPPRTVLAVSAAEVRVRRLALPGRSEAQDRAAALSLVAEDLAAQPEDCHVAVGAADGGEGRLAAVIDRARLRFWLDRAEALGAAPDAVVPDALLLQPGRDGWLTAARFGSLIAVRGSDLAAAVEPDLLPVLAEGRGLGLTEHPAQVEVLAAAGAVRPPVIDLLQGEFRRRSDARTAPPARLKRLAALAAAALIMPLVLVAAEGARRHAAASALEAEIERAARAALPQAARLVNPRAQLQERLIELGAGARMLDASAALFAALEETEGVRLDVMFYGEDGAIRASVAHANHSDLDLLRRALDKRGMSLTEDGGSQRDGRVYSDLVVRVRA